MNTRLWIGGLGLCLLTALQVVTSVGLAQSSSTANVEPPFIPGHHVDIEVSGHLGGCEPPDFPIPRFVGTEGQTIVLGDLGRWEIDPAGCSSVGGPWSYQIGELNVPLSSGMQSGPVVLVLEQT
ncbi:MAG: hypothetical protein DHS20C11_16460 [Lysobacteraceae bacterium]|nr:MAG: hypothetical protein DHS20C11_16460 [Xanthomonadaceae bacterium]